MSSDNNEKILDAVASPEDLREVAQQELGETAAVKEQALIQLRELILGEPLLDCPTDEDFLLKFLRARKYDVQNAFKNVKKYFKVRNDYPEMFEELKPTNVPFNDACRKHRLVTLSRKTDPKGRAVVKFRTGAWNTDICSLNDFFRITLIHAEHALLREEIQIRGIVAILDIRGLSVFHIAHYTPSVIKKFITLVQIRFFGYDCEELHNLVPDDVIPEEHGGTNESYDFDTIEEELKNEEPFFQKINAHGYRLEAENEDEVTRI